MAEVTRDELDQRAAEVGVDPADYGNDADLQAAVEDAEADDSGEQGEGVEGVQPLTEDDIPESGR